MTLHHQIAQNNRPIILVVDDDEINRQLLCAMLEDEYRIISAADGTTALRLARQSPQPDLILLDLIMSGMDGYEVCERLKTDVLTSDIPVIFVTSVSDEESECRGLQLGAADYITKPLNPSLTRLRVQKNITAKLDQERLRLAAKVIENASEGVLITNNKFQIVEVNQAVLDITGYSREEVLGQNPSMFKSGRQDAQFYREMWHSLLTTGAWQGEIWNRKKSGEIYPEHLSVNALLDSRNKISHYVAVFSDITRVKQYEFQLEHAAFYDALTNIPNRLLLADRMKQALARTKREQSLMCVCYFDLDGFKVVNDTLGHDAGDQVLIEISQRCCKSVRDDDTVARLGGDEFVILYVGLDSVEACRGSLTRMLARIAEPIVINGKTIQLGASIGVTVSPYDDADADTLLRHADQAMYHAKQAGKNQVCFYHLIPG